MERLAIYTDGAWARRYGVGGWGFVFVDPEADEAIFEHSTHVAGEDWASFSTELEAAALALEAARYFPVEKRYLLFTDCRAVQVFCYAALHDRYLKRKPSWVNYGRRLREAIQALDKPLNVHLVKAHSNHPWNDRADALAKAKIPPLWTLPELPRSCTYAPWDRRAPLDWPYPRPIVQMLHCDSAERGELVERARAAGVHAIERRSRQITLVGRRVCIYSPETRNRVIWEVYGKISVRNADAAFAVDFAVGARSIGDLIATKQVRRLGRTKQGHEIFTAEQSSSPVERFAGSSTA